MDLGQRKKLILQAIINDYIKTAEPVGSRTIAKKHELGLSSATIRNEMADLEEMGLLSQPHTSAGRIPSNLGYRIYVDNLMKKYKLSIDEATKIKKAFELKITELDRLIEEVSSIISSLTSYTSVVISPEMKSDSIKHIELIFIDNYTILLLLITSTGIVKNKKIRVSNEVSQDFIKKLSNVLNINFLGVSLENINSAYITKIASIFPQNDEIMYEILSFIYEILNEINKSKVFVGGNTNILNYPEFSDLDKAREFLSFLNEKRNLVNLIGESSHNNKINIIIGNESNYYQMKDSSMIISSYSIGNKIVGNIGIIGPMRMDYSKVISSIELFTKVLNELLYKAFYDE